MYQTPTQIIQLKPNPFWLDIGGGSPKPSASQIDSLATQVSKTPKQSATFRSSTGDRITLRSKPNGATLEAEIKTPNGKTIKTEVVRKFILFLTNSKYYSHF